MSLSLIDVLHSHARNRPGALAAVPVNGASDGGLTYAELSDRVGRLSMRLGPMLPGGGTVVLCAGNRPSYIVAFLAVLAADQTLFPIGPDSTAAELSQATQRAGAAVAIVDPFRAALPRRHGSARGTPLAELGDDLVLISTSLESRGSSAGPSLLLQSSGTTGEPKIVRRDGLALDAVTVNMVRACGFTATDHVLAAAPLCHSYGLEHGLLAPIYAGSCIHVCRDLICRWFCLSCASGTSPCSPACHLCSICSARPRTFGCRIFAAHTPPRPLPRATFDAFQQKFGLRIGQVYGATEIGSVTFSDPGAPAFDRASVGMPMSGVSIRILKVDPPHKQCSPDEEGQVAIAAPSMLSGYQDGSTRLIDGHFITGDLGLLTSGGALRITGRLKLLIDVGGRKVNPAEVEAVLRQHPDVGECVAFPLQLSATVTRIKAIVTPARPNLEIFPEDVRRFARERLSPYKVPRIIEVCEALPTSPSGKILRQQVEA